MTFSTSQRVGQDLLSDRMSSLRGLAQGSLGKERQAAGSSWGREPRGAGACHALKVELWV